MCSYNSHLCLHKGCLSLPVCLNTVRLFTCLHVWMTIRKVFIIGRLLRPCVQCQYSVCCVCAMLEINSSPAVSVVSHVSWFWFWTRGADRRLVTPGNLRSAILLHVQVFASFSHQGTGEEPGQRAFLLPSVYLLF